MFCLSFDDHPFCFYVTFIGCAGYRSRRYISVPMLQGSCGCSVFQVIRHEDQVNFFETVPSCFGAVEVYWIQSAVNSRLRQGLFKMEGGVPKGIAMTLNTRNQIHAFHPTLGLAMAIGPASTVTNAMIHCADTLRANPTWRYRRGMISEA